jgi:hypothetical protein
MPVRFFRSFLVPIPPFSIEEHREAAIETFICYTSGCEFVIAI